MIHVLQIESDELVAAVRRNDVHVDYIVFPDEGHGFRNRENEINGYRSDYESLSDQSTQQLPTACNG